MLKVYQIANGRWQITCSMHNSWKSLGQQFAAAILWRSFATRENAVEFIARWNGDHNTSFFV